MKRTGFLLAGVLVFGAAFTVAQSGQGAAPSAHSATSVQETPSAAQAGSSDAGALQPGSTSNPALQSRINDALRNEPTLGDSRVTAAVSDSGIDLSGTVGSVKDKQTAERIASSFDGNRKINDNIVVTGAGHSDLDPKHSALNNGGVGNTPNPAMNNGGSNNSPSSNPQK